MWLCFVVVVVCEVCGCVLLLFVVVCEVCGCVLLLFVVVCEVCRCVLLLFVLFVKCVVVFCCCLFCL